MKPGQTCVTSALLVSILMAHALESTLSVDEFFDMQGHMYTCVPRDKQKVEYPQQPRAEGSDYIELDFRYGNPERPFLQQIKYQGFRLRFSEDKTRMFYKEVSDLDGITVQEYSCVNDTLYPQYITCRDEHKPDDLDARRSYQYNNDIYKFNLNNNRYEIVETQTWWSSDESYADYGSTVFIEHGYCRL